MSASDSAADAIAASGLIRPGSRGVVLFSGGPDSLALLAGLVEFSPDPAPVALHLNYRLRDESGEDEAVCVEVCRRLGVELVVEQAGKPQGNLQGWARQLRYAAAEELREQRGAEWVATGHTKSDVAETVLYRLASSPGRRALAAMPPRRGRLVRPILAIDRQQARAYADDSGLPFADDMSNHDPDFSRVRIRSEVIPALSAINRAVETNILRTRAELLEEGELLEQLAGELLGELELEGGRLDGPGLSAAHPALRRIALRRYAEQALGVPVPFPAELVERTDRLLADPEGGQADLGGGAALVVAAGAVSVRQGSEPGPPEGRALLELPGMARWGGWTLEARTLAPPFTPAGPERATIDLGCCSGPLTVRGWQPGDRIQPLGMEGSKTLQDLFTDARVPRTERQRMPVLLDGENVVWVPGLGLGHAYRLAGGTTAAAVITATPPAADSQGGRARP